MGKLKYNKPATSVNDQISLLESRGMVFSDKLYATKFLSNINYYRLSGYWIPFELSRNPHSFQPGTTFESVINLYEFDKMLRFILFEGISKFEVSFRTQFAHQMGLDHGSHSYLDPHLCNNFSDWISNMSKVQNEKKRSTEKFIKHFDNVYEESFPPIWVVCEIFSMGTLSCWYKNLIPGTTKDKIAQHYNIDNHLLESWIHTLSVIRNHCAHQSRIILKPITVNPKKPLSSSISISNLWDTKRQSSLYNIILVLRYLSLQIDTDSGWKDELFAFLNKNKEMIKTFLHFPDNWYQDSFWNL